MSAIVIYENDGTVSYTLGATPSTGPFAIDFPYYFADEIEVTKIEGTLMTPLVQGADYTLTGTVADDGFWSGSMVTTSSHHDCVIRIDRSLRTTKATNFPETGAISIPGMNTLFSRLFSWVQDLNRRMAQIVTDALAGLYMPLAGGTMEGPLSVIDLRFINDVAPADASRWQIKVRDDGTLAFQPIDSLGNVQLDLDWFDRTGKLTVVPPSTDPASSEYSSDIAITSRWFSTILGKRGQGEGVWKYVGTNAAVSPGNGGFAINHGAGNVRSFAISNTDGDNVFRYLKLLRPGDSIIVTSELTPITAYARYDLVDVVVQASGYVTFTTHVTDSIGFDSAPVIDTRYHLSGYLNTASGANPITGVITTDAGSNLQGGGSTGDLHLSVVTSPTFTGVPKTPKPISASDNTTQIPTTSWVMDLNRQTERFYGGNELSVPFNELQTFFPLDHSTIKRLTVDLYAWSSDGQTRQMGFNLITAGGPIVTNNYHTNNAVCDGFTVNPNVNTTTFWFLPIGAVMRATLELSFNTGAFTISGHCSCYLQNGNRNTATIGWDLSTTTSLVTGIRSTFTDLANFAAGSYIRVHATF